MSENANSGQGQAQGTTVTNPAFGTPPVANGASVLQITAEEYHKLRSFESQLGEFQKKYQADLDAQNNERLKVIGEKEGVQKLLEESNKGWQRKLDEANGSIAKVRDLYHSKAKSEALSAPLAGIEFVGNDADTKAKVAANFRTLIEGRFEVREDDAGNLVVRDKVSGRPAADVMKELLNAPEYQGFFAPKTRGGSGTDGTGSASTSATATENPHQFGSLDWHAWQIARSRSELTGLRVINKS